MSLARHGVFDVELAGVDVGRELRWYTHLQVWIVVTLIVVVVAVALRHGA